MDSATDGLIASIIGPEGISKEALMSEDDISGTIIGSGFIGAVNCGMAVIGPSEELADGFSLLLEASGTLSVLVDTRKG